MATPSSVKAKGKYLVPPFLFEVLKLHLNVFHSFFESSNMKSEGKRLMFALTALLRYFLTCPL